jgi:sucrose phosphorylase
MNDDQAFDSPERREILRQRILRRLQFVYGEHTAETVAGRLFRLLDRWHQQIPVACNEHCWQWDQSSKVLITYGNSIQEPGATPLQTLKDFLETRFMGAISTVHILPFFPYTSDHGFSVIDYREVDEDLGSWDDIRAIAAEFGLMVDLVINHCSRENLWFYDYVANIEPYNDYFIEVEDSPALALVTRPRSSPLLTAVRTHRGKKHLWATFSHDQIDLNFRNPAVLLEMIDTMLFYVAAGTRIVRLDAIAYLWKELGTTCIHLPQTHELVKLLRDILSCVDPRCLLLTETNVPNDENRSYFGDSDEAQLIYQFSLPPLLLQALHTGCTHHLMVWAKGLAAHPPPTGCTYLNFTASHDGVGLRPLEGLVPADEVQKLLEAMRARGGYLTSRRNSDGTESPYELNISYFDALRDIHVESDPWHVPCFMVSQLVALSMQGIPALYIHSFTATPNDQECVEKKGRTRLINRRQWDRGELNALIDDPMSANGRVFNDLVRVCRLRNDHLAFHPDAGQQILDLPPQLFGFIREGEGERIICLFNFTPDERELSMDEPFWPDNPGERWKDLLSDELLGMERGRMRLMPYASLWLVPA